MIPSRPRFLLQTFPNLSFLQPVVTAGLPGSNERLALTRPIVGVPWKGLEVPCAQGRTGWVERATPVSNSAVKRLSQGDALIRRVLGMARREDESQKDSGPLWFTTTEQ